MPWVPGGTPPGMLPGTVKRLTSPKAPLDQVPITLDFSGALAAIDCDKLDTTATPSISSIRNDGQPSDLVFIPPASFSEDATRISVWVAAGTATFEYLVTAVVTSVDEQTVERSFIIPVYYR